MVSNRALEAALQAEQKIDNTLLQRGIKLTNVDMSVRIKNNLLADDSSMTKELVRENGKNDI